MKVLFVVPYVPSLVRVRPFNLIRQLSARGHQVTVTTLWSNEQEHAEVEALRDHCDEVHAVHLPAWRSLLNCARALPSSEPLQAVYSWSEALFSRVQSLLAGADVMHVEHLRGARYGVCAERYRAGVSTPIVWDSVDCISYLFEQASESRRDRFGKLINRLELSRTRRYEGWLSNQFDRVLITSRADQQALASLASAPQPGRITVLPNGVDTTYFAPTGESRDSGTLVFSGKMSYHANVSAARHLVSDVMPLVWARQPDVRLTIVGKEPPAELRALAERHAPLVSVTGTVADIRPFLRKATAAVVPLVYGAGVQNKVLEAMACGTPVVATPRAVSALNTEQGRDVLVAEGAEQFADEVLGVLDSPARQRELGHAGRRYVETHHRWDRIAAKLEGVYADVVERYQGQHGLGGNLLSA